MADYQKIDNDVRRFAASFAGFIEAAKVLGEIATIEQAAKESETRLNSARRAEQEYLEAATMRKGEAEAAIEAAQAAAASIVSKAHDQSRTIIVNATAQAEQIVEKATQDSASGRTRYERALVETQGNIETAKAEHRQLKAKITEAQSTLAALESQIGAATQRHGEIQQQINSLRARFLG